MHIPAQIVQSIEHLALHARASAQLSQSLSSCSIDADVLKCAFVTGLRGKLADAADSLHDVFANPGLRRIQLAFAGSIVGDWAYAVAVAVYAYDHGGATAVGVLGVIRYVSLAVVTPFASVLGDRYPRRLVMVVSDSTRAVLVLAAAALIAEGGPSLAVYAFAILTSLCGSPFRSAQASLLPELANGPGDLSAANVASSTVESVGFFAGPALAGLLLAVASIQVVYLFNAVTFVWSAALVLGVRTGRREPEAPATTNDADEPAEDPTGFLYEVSAGYREILHSRDLRLLIGLYCAQTVVAGASLVFTVSLALGLLDIGRSGLGFLNATLGIGGLIGGFLALVLAQRGRLARDFGIGVFFWSAPLLLVAAWPTIGAAVAVMILLGLANSVVDVNAYTILQRVAPPAAMARVFGAMESAVIGGMALGALLMPALIATIGLRWGLVVIGAGVSACVVLGLGGLRRIDLTALAPPGLDLLRGVSILALLPEPTLERLARALVRVEAAPGDVVIREGDHGDRFYVIESGTVEVTKAGRHVASLGPGDFVGEIALLRDIPRVATVTATSPAVLQALDRAHFIPAVTGQGDFRDAAEAAMTTRLAML
jgi:MFS family permease